MNWGSIKNIFHTKKNFESKYTVAMVLAILLVSIYWEMLHSYSSKILIPSLDNKDGGYGDGPLLIHTLWRSTRDGFFDNTNLLNSYPFGEPGFGVAYISQILLWFPLYILANLLGPIAAFNTFALAHIFLNGFLGWLITYKITKNFQLSLLSIPLILLSPFNLNLVGGPTGLIQQSSILLTLYFSLGILTNPKKITGVFIVLSLTISLYSDLFIFLNSWIIICCLFLFLIFSKSLTNTEKMFRFKILIISLISFVILNIYSIYYFYLGSIGESSGVSYLRSYDEWIAFGAQWWMFLTPTEGYIPFIGQFRPQIISLFTDNNGSVLRQSAQAISPHLAQLAIIVILFVGYRKMQTLIKTSSSRSKKFPLVTQAPLEKSVMRFLLLILSFTLVIMLVPTADQSTDRRLYPSFYLFQIISVFRYTVRLNVILTIASSVLIIYLANMLFKNLNTLNYRISKKSVTMVVVLITSVSASLYIAVPSADKYVDLGRSPDLYQTIEARNSPYAEFPNLDHYVLFPGSAFQVVTQQPTLDDVSSSPIAKEIAERLNAMCDLESSGILYTLGFRTIFFHTDLKGVKDIDWTRCGYEIISDSSKAKQGSVGHASWQNWDRGFLLSPVSPKVREFLVPAEGQWHVQVDENLRSTWASLRSESSLKTVFLGERVETQVRFKLFEGEISEIFCSKEVAYDHQVNKKRITFSKNKTEVKFNISPNCKQVFLSNSSEDKFVISPPIQTRVR
jgi:hypothetical protein